MIGVGRSISISHRFGEPSFPEYSAGRQQYLPEGSTLVRNDEREPIGSAAKCATENAVTYLVLVFDLGLTHTLGAVGLG